MSERTIDDQLNKYLVDAHAIEEQALVQMRQAPRIAGDEQLGALFQEHERETEAHEHLVAARLKDRGATPSKLEDLAMKAGGAGFALFAASQPDTPGKLVAHAYSYEHLELASYELLARVAERAGDRETADVARRIGAEERAMAERLAGAFDSAVVASLRDVPSEDLREQLAKYLADAHAIENQAIELLQRGSSIVGEGELARAFEEHLAQTREHQRLVEERLEALGGSPSRLKDAVMRLGALNWGGFFAAQPDTPGKLAAFAYAFEHLEIAAYEELRRVAERAADPETVQVAERILAEERGAAERIAALFDRAMVASLEAAGVTRDGVSAGAR
jgi:ferritin-like metal-binding protein YciE